MSQRHPLALVAGAATLLAALPLTTVYATFTWLFYTAVAIAMITGTAMAVRSLRGPLWVQVSAMLAVLMLYLTWSFPSGAEFARLVPSASTFRHFGQLLNEASGHVQDEAVPVPDFDGLIMLTVAGVGLVAIMVDFLAVGLRRPALAGLPMLAIYSVPVAVMPTGLSFVPFGFAAAGYLWLLVTDSVDRVRRFGRRFTGDGRDVDVWEPSPLASAGRRLGVVGIIIAVLLPLVIPGMTSGLFDKFGPGFGPGVGEGGPGSATGPVVNMFAFLDGQLHRETAFTMVKVRNPDPQPYYLRFGVADQISEEGFASRAPSGNQRLDALTEFPPSGKAGVTEQRYQAQIEIVDFEMQLAPIFLQPVRSTGLDGSWLYDTSTNQVFSRRTSSRGKSYTIDYVRTDYSPAALRTASPINAADPGLRELTRVPQVKQVTDLVSQLTATATTEYDRVLAIHRHFSIDNGYGYSVQTEPGTSGNPIVDFLTNKRGFCIQYAAAMAWLVRAAGYPARVAFGFTRGGAPVNGVSELTNFNLHAWTEVYFPDFGWVPFDATPPSGVQGWAATPWAPDPSDPAPPAGPGQNEREITPRPDLGGNPNEPNAPDPGAAGGTALTWSDAWWIGGALAVLLIIAALFAPALRRQRVRRARLSRSGSLIVLDGAAPPRRAGPGSMVLVLDDDAIAAARRDAHEAWAELLDSMIDFDVPVDEAETPRATGVRLGEVPSLVSVKDQALLLARAEERARYARAPLHPEGLDQAVQATRRALTEGATFPQRLRAMLMPRSELLRWRSAWISFVGRTIAVAGRIRETVAQASPRRLLTERAGR